MVADRPRLPPRPGLYRGPVVEVQAQPVSEPRPAVPPDPGSNPEVARAPKSARTPTLRSASRFDSSLIWAAAKTWSPAGIAAAITLVFLALGGREGVLALAQGLSESISGARALTAEMAALRSEMGALRAEIAAERDQRHTLSANLRRTERNLSLVCDLA